MAKKRRALLVLGTLFALVAAVYFGVGGIVKAQRAKVVSLEAGIEALQAETVPLRFMILERGPSSLSVRLKLYDLSGREFAAVDRELPGKQLYLDFLAAPRDGDWIAFPWKLFSDAQAPADGFGLAALVAPDGLPLTYGGGAFGAEALAELGRLYAALGKGEKVKGSFGNAVHDVAELGSFETGIVYRVVLRKKGGIEIMEE